MVKNKFAIITDSILTGLIFFILGYFWLYKFTKIKNLSLIISLIIFLLFFFIQFFLLSKKNNKIVSTRNEKKFLEECLKTLKYQGIKENSMFFSKLFSCNYLGSNIYQNENCYLYINLQSILGTYDFLCANNFFMQTDKSIQLIFISDKTSEDFNNLLNNSPTKYNCYEYKDLIEIMKNKKIFPKNNLINVSKTKNFKIKYFIEKFKILFLKIKFRECFFAGLSLIVFSIFIPYSLYYLIIGSLLLILAFLSLFNKFNIIEKKDNKITLNQLIK